MALLVSRLKGNTLVEVLISLAIISFCMTLAVLIYLNIQKSSLPHSKLKAIELAEAFMVETVEHNSFRNESHREGEYTMSRVILRHPRYPDCVKVRIVVRDILRRNIFELERVARQIAP